MPNFQAMWGLRIHTVINTFEEKYDKTSQGKLSPDVRKMKAKVCIGLSTHQQPVPVPMQ